MNQELLKSLCLKTSSRIVLLVIDGLGGLPVYGKTELEAAKTPNLDRLARESSCGLIDPVGCGITPGSGPGHLALFGYDPMQYQIGRGILEALGIDFPLQPGDLAVRGNFASIDASGVITDRRAGRIATERNTELCQLLDGLDIDGVTAFVKPVKEHRVAIVFRGTTSNNLPLSANLSETDPQKEGLCPLPVGSLYRGGDINEQLSAEGTAMMANRFIEQAKERLSDAYPSNMILLRGWAKSTQLPLFEDLYKLTPAAIATYPMYRGIAKLVGMKVLETGTTIQDQINTLKENLLNYDFFYLHVKKTDSAGEDGNFKLKVELIEEVDRALPEILSLCPDVLIVTGDHSTPAKLKAHSWHPVPILIHSQYCRYDNLTEFSESSCQRGSLGRFLSLDVMPLALANGLKLTKYGA